MDSEFKKIWIWVIYLLLFAITIPWYWPKDTHIIIMGFPIWALVNIIGSFFIACFTATLLIKSLRKQLSNE